METPSQPPPGDHLPHPRSPGPRHGPHTRPNLGPRSPANLYHPAEHPTHDSPAGGPHPHLPRPPRSDHSHHSVADPHSPVLGRNPATRFEAPCSGRLSSRAHASPLPEPA